MKTVVITGANRGIGLALVKQYLESDFKVIALCRKSSNELSATSAKVIEGIDVSSDEIGNSLKKSLEGVSIDILINNAGIFLNEDLGEIDYKNIEKQFLVNSIGPLRVTEALIDKIPEFGKIALVSSRMGSSADNTSGGYYGYRMSKSALNIAGVSLSQDVKDRGVSVAILHPGFVQTDMVNNQGDISADQAAKGLKSVIDKLNLENSGTFWHSNGENLPW